LPETNALAFIVLASMYTILFIPYVLVAMKHPQAIAVTGAFRSVWAARVAGLGALGILGALGFVPTWERLFGFMGLFGFIGIAYITEAIVRFKSRTA
jgi:hypothetical protein